MPFRHIMYDVTMRKRFVRFVVFEDEFQVRNAPARVSPRAHKEAAMDTPPNVEPAHKRG